ncbi:MAG: ribonuclease Y [Ruminococcaceae bacterium]|nr:ribonuclease Y [Oscillospiraceae bacterium]
MDGIQIAVLVGVVVLAVVGVFLAFRYGYSYRKKVAEGKIGSAEEEAKKIIENAKSKAVKDAEHAKKERLLEAKEEIHKERNELDKEIKERRNEIQRQERRIQQKEDAIDKKTQILEKKEEQVQAKLSEVDSLKEETEKVKKLQLSQLEKIAELSVAEAKDLLLKQVEIDARHDAALLIKNIEEQAKEEAESKARNIITGAIQRCAADHVAETTVSVVQLPNDEMKGRIIGREGRNIRSIETLTGVDLIIDDTPEAVILSGFDPVRREIARLSLEKLIVDGRIHPGRIEETVEKSRREVENIIKQEGEQATFDTGVHGLHPELIKLLGRLKYRTSYGQNVLKHSVEVAHLAGLMAAELGADVALAKRAGLLHDIGKAIDHEVEGSHVTIGADVAKKYKENDKVVHAIMAHHGDVEPNSLVACLVQAADTISAARTGARRENIESYIKRLEALEEIANSFAGVDRSFAIQAGREIRIMVKPDRVDDDETILLAKDIVKKIESSMEYPGQIKVNVIREVRTVEYAK